MRTTVSTLQGKTIAFAASGGLDSCTITRWLTENGVNVVCVVDPAYKTVNLHFPDQPSKELEGDAALTFADLPGFTLPVSKFFE